MMYAVVYSLVPALLMSVYVFGWSAIYVTFLAIASCIFFEFAISKYFFKQKASVWDGSAIITGVLLAFNLPAGIPWWAIVLGSLFAMGVGKMAFGGLGNNPFNPALVGRVFLLISFPVPMTQWPEAMNANRWTMANATTGATPLAVIKEGLDAGVPISELTAQIPGFFQLFTGMQGGCIGEVSGLALVLGFLYLLYRKITTWHIPVAVLGTIALITGVLWLIDPTQYMSPVFHLITGGVLLGALYMATDYVTSPMTPKGMIIFGVGIGVITVLIRLWGSYPEGVSFAILIMNAAVPLIDRYFKPKRFGAVRNGK
jgi:electron transport complex protein RnfD